MNIREQLTLAALAVLALGTLSPAPAAADSAADPATLVGPVSVEGTRAYAEGTVEGVLWNVVPQEAGTSTCTGLCGVNGAADGATTAYTVSGKMSVTCGGSLCGYTFSFPVTFANPPVVVCSAGPWTRTGWNPLVCMVEWVSGTQFRVAIDSTDGSQSMSGSGSKDIRIIANGA